MDTYTLDEMFKVAVSHSLTEKEAPDWEAEARIDLGFESHAAVFNIQVHQRTTHNLHREHDLNEVLAYKSGPQDFVSALADKMVDQLRAGMRDYKRANRPLRAA